MLKRYATIGMTGVVAICLAAGTSNLFGCGAGFEVGPEQITIDVQGGTLAQADFQKAAATIPVDLCDLPTEAELKEELQNAVPGIDLANLVQFSRMEIVNATVTATSGTFLGVDSVTAEYVPKPVGGQAQTPISLGSVTAPPAMGTTLVFTPPSTVDMLALVRANDANSGPGCPQINTVFTATTAPSGGVTWTTTITVNVWARIGGS